MSPPEERRAKICQAQKRIRRLYETALDSTGVTDGNST